MNSKQTIINALYIELLRLRGYYVELTQPKGIGEYELVDYEGYNYAINLINQFLAILEREEANEKEQHS